MSGDREARFGPRPFTRCGRLDTSIALRLLERGGLCEPGRRPLLLRGVGLDIVSRLRSLERPFEQLLADFQGLREAPAEGRRSPLGALFRNASMLLRGWPMADLFGAIARVLDAGGLGAMANRPALVWIPSGRLSVGPLPTGPSGRAGASPDLTVVAPVLMSATPITRAQFAAALGEAPPDDQGDRPVVGVDVQQAHRYCDALSIAEGLRPVYGGGGAARAANGFRLPDEVEWEYACRAGSTAAWWFGDDADLVGDVAWFVANSAGEVQPVGVKACNPWGLHDMHGNIWEWATPTSMAARGARPRSVIRGGSCRDRADALRSSVRIERRPGERRSALGFRVVRPA